VRGDDAELMIRFLSQEELQQIREKASKIVRDGKHGPRMAFDSIEGDVLLGRAAVRGWKGLTMNGEEFPYSPENCDLLMRKWTEFARFVFGICLDLRKFQ